MTECFGSRRGSQTFGASEEGLTVSVASPRSRRPTVASLIALTVVTGLVDSVSYLRLGHVFVANMTGNVVFLGFSVDRQSGLSAIASLVALSGFALGALGGGRMASSLAGGPSRWLGAAFGTEASILAVVAVLTASGTLPLSGRGNLVTIAMMAVAMGVQNSTVRHFGVPDLSTTVLSLTFTGLFADSPLAGGSGARVHRRLGSMGAMLAGAALGAWLLQDSPSGVIALAAVLSGAAAAVFMTGEAGTAPAGSLTIEPRAI
jgi:uncharacterized membrane protein YoaK (UPF0700 family)